MEWPQRLQPLDFALLGTQWGKETFHMLVKLKTILPTFLRLLLEIGKKKHGQ
jgi:hypothetical protein